MTGDGGLDLVDLSLSTAGRWCSKLFSMAGERITRFAPMSERLAGQGRSLSALRAAYLDVDPTVLVDWDHRDTLERVDAAVARADVVITSFEGGRYDGPYDAGRIRALNPGAVHLTLSPFGIVGPYRTLRTSSIVDWAASGYLYITGEPDREPLAGPTEFCSYVAGYTGAAAIEAAWHHRRRHGGGHVHLDVSVMEAMLGVHNSLFSRVSTGEIVGRTGNDVGPGTYPHVTYPGSDGELFLGIVTDEEWDRFVIAIDRTDLAADDRVRTGADRKAHRDVVDAVVLPWIAETPVDAAAAGLQARHVPATRECTAADILRDAQVIHRGFLRPLTVDGGAGLAPGDPVRTEVRPEPARPEGIGSSGARAAEGGRRIAGVGPANASSSMLPLAGIVVVDVTLWWAGPSATRILGDLGARVIRLERPSAFPLDLPASQQFVNEKMNRNKLGVAIDLKVPDGQQLARRLAERADVMVQNYRPGVLDRLDLGYRSVAAANPGVVYVSLSGFGTEGPKADWGSYGTLIEAASSIRSRTRYAGGPGMRLGTQLPDGVGGVVGALAALRGLRRRHVHGVGVHYDLSQLETYVAMSGEGILAASLGADTAEGDDGDERVLRCAGDDEWIAVGLPDEATVTRLAARYAGAAGGGDDGWAILGAVAARREKADLARELQELGVAAFPVVNAAELAADAHLRARGSLIAVRLGDRRAQLPGSPLRATTSPFVAEAKNAPRLGADTVEVLRDDLGLSPAEITDLIERKVVAGADPGSESVPHHAP